MNGKAPLLFRFRLRFFERQAVVDGASLLPIAPILRSYLPIRIKNTTQYWLSSTPSQLAAEAEDLTLLEATAFQITQYIFMRRSDPAVASASTHTFRGLLHLIESEPVRCCTRIDATETA